MKTHAIRRSLQPGLHRLTVAGDGSDFNWEDLYIVLNLYNNTNQRTGPWDFNLLENNRPVLPAYWVYVNDRKIGLWYFNRPSNTQIKTKCFQGEASFWIKEAGDYEFRFEPYREFNLTWAKTEFSVEPDDTLLDRVALRPAAQRGWPRLFDSPRWENLAARLNDPDFPYRSLLRESLDGAKTAERGSVPLPLLAAGWRLRQDKDALARARELIERLLALPAWGNPRADGYGHNGDMGAANVILDLATALNLLDGALDQSMQQRIIARLEQQADTFLEMGLLHRGYWGGSILQDHGFCSFSWLTTAAYALVGWTPKAEEWLRFCVPRMQRTFNALPTDGVVPQTSYHLIALYTDKVVLLRELHRQATGEDIYQHPAWRNVPKYAFASYLPEGAKFLHASCRGDLTHFYGGHPFLDQMARDFHDAEAAWLAREYVRIVSSKGLYHGVQEQAMFAMTLWATLLWEPVHLPDPPRPRRSLRWFNDTGAIVYRDEPRELLFSARCGPPQGLTADRHTTCPCDRLSLGPLSGTFAITKHGLPLIQNAEGGYKIRTELGNVVLVDGQGQLDDHAPPMSLPDARYGGEQIAKTEFDPRTGRGYVLMNLTPAYEPALGLTSYTREFFFESDGRLRLVDTIAARQPHRFTWLFHTFKSHPMTATGDGEFTIQNKAETLQLALANSSAPLRHAIQWSSRRRVRRRKSQRSLCCDDHLPGNCLRNPKPIGTGAAGRSARIRPSGTTVFLRLSVFPPTTGWRVRRTSGARRGKRGGQARDRPPARDTLCGWR